MNLGAALVALFIALVIKVAVMLVGAWLLVKVYRSTYATPPKRPWLLIPPENRREVKLLFAALICFYASELTCGIEIYVIFRSSPWTSCFHSVVSATGMALFAVGLWEYIDKKLVRYGGSSCLLNRMCSGCTFSEGAGCKFWTALLLIGSFVALAALPPFLASTSQMVADPRRWMLPFPALNAWYDDVFQPWLRGHIPGLDASGAAYYILEIVNVVEFRITPAVALVLAVLGTTLVWRRREQAGLKLVLAAVGMLGYVYLELVTFRLHGDALAGGVMHEVAEFWFLLITAELLARAFSDREKALTVSTAAAPV